VNPTAFGILALSAAGSGNGLSRSAGWLRSAQNADGGWGFARGSASDPDSTGAALQALAAAGGSRGAISAGVGWLKGAQDASGGFAITGGSANAQSTAWAVQGLIAGGSAPASARSAGHSPLDYLSSVQAADGHYRYSSSSDQTRVWVTGQALAAVNGEAFPVAPVPRRSAARTRAASADQPAAGGAAVTPGDGSAAGAPAPAGEKAKPAQGATAGASAPAAPQAPPGAVALDPASATDGSDEDDGGVPAWLIAIGATGAIAASVWGGWVMYRRRLP
jgi:hypothetical protein